MWKRGRLDTFTDKIISYMDSIFVDHAIFRLFWRSYAKIDDFVYRSNQPLPYQIKLDIKRNKIRSIINLRGKRDCSSYYLEKNFCKTYNVKLYDFPISSRDMPSKDKLNNFFKLLDAVEYPISMHCKSGADRAGLAAALYLIYKKRLPVAVALKQLSLKHLHIKYAKTGVLDFFFRKAIEDDCNMPERFILWIEKKYNPKMLKEKFMSNRLYNVLVDRLLKRE